MAKQMVPFNTVRAMPNIGLRTYRILILNHTGRPKKTLKELRGITGDPQTDLKSVLKKQNIYKTSLTQKCFYAPTTQTALSWRKHLLQTNPDKEMLFSTIDVFHGRHFDM